MKKIFLLYVIVIFSGMPLVFAKETEPQKFVKEKIPEGVFISQEDAKVVKVLDLLENFEMLESEDIFIVENEDADVGNPVQNNQGVDDDY